MATAKKDIEIFLDSITLDKTMFKGKSKRIADFRIVYPRLTLAQKTTSKTLTLDGATLLKPQLKSWTDRILFKEGVQGTFGIEFSLSDAVSDKNLENAASSTAASLLKLFGDLMSSELGIKAMTGFAELPATGLAKLLSGSSYSVKTAATGAIDIPGSAYGSLKSEGETTLSFPIVAARAVVEERHRSTKGDSDRVTRKTIVKEDAVVGSVTLTIKAL